MIEWKKFTSLVFVLLFTVFLSTNVAGQEQLPEENDRPKIGLVLGGGGARGFAHIGILRVLKELDIPVDYIAGTSIGALVGALYASGYSVEDLDWVTETVDWEDVFSDTPPRQMWSFLEKRRSSKYLAGLEFTGKGLKLPAGLTKGQKISTLFSFLTMPVSDIDDFDRLPIPYRAVATDIEKGEKFVISGGNLSEAMRASMSVPGVFTPVEIDGRLLVDGGIVRNLPVDVVKEMGADIVIAIDVSSGLATRSQLDNPFAILNQMVGVQMVNNTKEQSKDADFFLRPDLQDYTSGDFVHGVEIAELGEQAARAQIDELRTLADSIRQARPEAHAPEHSLGDTFQNAYLEDAVLEGDLEPKQKTSLYHFLEQDKGGAVRLERLEHIVAMLFSTGNYESVNFALTPGKDEHGYVMHLRLKEKTVIPHLLRFGMYYESRQGSEEPDKMVMLLNATFNNLSGRGSWWSTDFQFVNVLKLRSQYLQPLGKGLFLMPEVYYDDDFQTVYKDQKAIANYDVQESGVGLYLGALFTKLGFIAAGYNWEAADVNPTAELDSQEYPHFDESIGSLIARSSFDRLDQFPFPHSGGLLELEYQWASQDLGGDVDYQKLSIEAWRYFPLATRHTLGLHLLAGSDFDTDLRPYKKFLVGGRESFVGYKVEELRGAYAGTARLEYRYQFTKLPSPIGGGVYATLIGDVGNVWQTWDEVEEDFDLRYGGSIGVAVDSILGPITADYSLGDEGRQVFYVNIGLKF